MFSNEENYVLRQEKQCFLSKETMFFHPLIIPKKKKEERKGQTVPTNIRYFCSNTHLKQERSKNMNFLNTVEKDILDKFKEKGIPLDEVQLITSSKKELGDYQINDAMKLAKIMHKSPRDIAEDLVKCLEETGYFKNINIAGAGFINLSFKDELLTEYVEKVIKSSTKDVEKLNEERIIIDYGGANIAKTLHVGHLRSANIGEAIKRLARHLGKEVK